jgi:hypothetical protein
MPNNATTMFLPPVSRISNSVVSQNPYQSNASYPPKSTIYQNQTSNRHFNPISSKSQVKISSRQLPRGGRATAPVDDREDLKSIYEGKLKESNRKILELSDTVEVGICL